MINCSNCGSSMVEVTAPQHYGGRVKIEQCEKCGGLWFDKNEFVQVKIGAAVDLEKIDIAKLSELSTIENEALSCPRDRHNLKLYKDPYFFDQGFLKDFKIFSCEECGGFWFNRGVFTVFQGRRAEEKIKSSGSAALAKSIMNLDSFKNDLQEKEKLRTALGSQTSVAWSDFDNIGTGDWRLDILFDIIAAIFRRIFG